MNRWYKLDNAAKVFPAVTSKKNSSVFRLSAVLTRPVDKDILQKSVDHIYDRFPMMFVKMRRGVFWQYFDSSPSRYLVEKEQSYPCGMINPYENNGYLLKIFYFGNRISVEVFHAITDGGGASEFLKTIVYYYLTFAGNKIDGEGKIILVDDGIQNENMEDSFAKNYEQVKQYKKKTSGEGRAYQIKGTPYENYGQNVISAVVSASAVSKVAKARGATVTSYLASLLIGSIHSASQKYSADKNPIVIDIPVSLRNRFQSGTLRNFFAVVNVGMSVNDSTELDVILPEITRQLKAKTEKDSLLEVMANNLSLEKAIYSRLVPLFIKKALIMIGFNMRGEAKTTMAISNLGNVQVPSGFSQWVRHMEIVLYTTPKSPVKCGICSVNDRLVISFSRSITETDIIKHFIKSLTENGELDVEVYSNEWGH